VSETCRLRRGEGYAVRDDESPFEIASAEPIWFFRRKTRDLQLPLQGSLSHASRFCPHAHRT